MTGLKVLENEDASLGQADRLEPLTALIEAPGFDPLYRSDLIAIAAPASGLRMGMRRG